MLIGSMHEYFREALQAGMKKTAVRLSENAQAYLVHLLAEFARADHAFAGTGRGERTVLADLLGRAQDADPHEALRIYKHMGDSSLYLTGFFAGSVDHAAVGPEYYVQMGGAAYAQVSDLMRPSTSAALFAELSDRFRSLVDLLAMISVHQEPGRQLADLDVLQLVERYQRTGRREVLEALAQQGVVLRPGLLDDDGDVH